MLSSTPRAKLMRAGSHLVVRQWRDSQAVHYRSGGVASSAVAERQSGRAKQAVRGIIWSNTAGDTSRCWFWTATLTGVADFDRLAVACVKFGRLFRAEFPDAGYCVVPELKNGRWHVHGVFFGLSPELLRSRYQRQRSASGKAYDGYMLRFRQLWASACGQRLRGERGRFVSRGVAGRCAIEPIRSRGGVTWYLAKYITKDLVAGVPRGRKCYWAGGCLARPSFAALPRMRYDSGEARAVEFADLPDMPLADFAVSRRGGYNGAVSIYVYNDFTDEKFHQLLDDVRARCGVGFEFRQSGARLYDVRVYR